MKNKKSGIIISLASLGQEKEIAYIHKKTWLTTYPNRKNKIFKKDILLKDFDSEKKLLWWRNIIKNNGKGNNYLCIAKKRQKVVGFCFALKKERYNEVKILYVLPEFQGKRIGRRLLNEATRWLGWKKDIIVMVVDYNEKAIGFYEKYGFIKSGRVCSSKFPNGKEMREIQLLLKAN